MGQFFGRKVHLRLSFPSCFFFLLKKSTSATWVSAELFDWTEISEMHAIGSFRMAQKSTHPHISGSRILLRISLPAALENCVLLSPQYCTVIHTGTGSVCNR